MLRRRFLSRGFPGRQAARRWVQTKTDGQSRCRARVDEREHRGRRVYSLLYMFFWPWNAPYQLAGQAFGAHVGDLEHVRVIVDKRTMRIIKARNFHTLLEARRRLVSSARISRNEISGVQLQTDSLKPPYLLPGLGLSPVLEVQE